MKNIFKILMPITIIVALTACNKSLDQLSQNENKPTSVPPSLLLTGVLNNIYDAPFTKYEIWDQYYISNYDYYGNNRYDFGSGNTYYGTLENVIKMEEEAIKSGGSVINPYSALGKFFRAYFFVKMTMQMGDVPMTEALKGSANLTPVYDAQKKVFQQSLLWLDSANTYLSSLIIKGDNTLAGDTYYGNDLKRWQKLVNTFRIRVLIDLSAKETDADLNIKQQFADIVNNPSKYPVMQSANDDLKYVYINPTNKYPNNPGNYGFDNSRSNASATYLGILTSLKDPRTFITAEPARYYVDVLKQSPTDFDSFVGADPGLDLGVMYANAGQGKYSFLGRKRYYSTYTGENSIQVGYAELCFNIAEGINRGWVTGKIAEDYYKAGIKASMQFYGIPDNGPLTVYFYRPGSTNVENLQNYDSYIVNVDFNAYYNQAAVKYNAGATGLQQILTQKYVALFRHSGLESYYTYRRTGVPTFTTGPGTGNGGRIALRFQYPSSERSANTANYNAAIQSQFGSSDDINSKMWLLK